MSTTRNRGCGYAVLVGVTIVITITLIFAIGFFVPTASLLWSGIPAQGTIVAAQSCQTGGKEPGCNYTMRFTDRAGQVHLATLHGKDVTMPGTSSFTIVYLANDPETIDLPRSPRSAVDRTLDKCLDQTQQESTASCIRRAIVKHLLVLPRGIYTRSPRATESASSTFVPQPSRRASWWLWRLPELDHDQRR